MGARPVQGKDPRDPTIREKFNTYRFADYKDDGQPGAGDNGQLRNDENSQRDEKRASLISVARESRLTEVRLRSGPILGHSTCCPATARGCVHPAQSAPAT